MIDKIKTLIYKIKLRLIHNKCYYDMEHRWLAVFGMCSGEIYKDTGIPHISLRLCDTCPYFVKRSDTE